MTDGLPQSAVVLGARNLGAALVHDLLARGVPTATIARTQRDLETLRRLGAFAIAADAADPGQLAAALHRVSDEMGPPELIVNATAPARPADDRAGFGGGPIVSASEAGLEAWAFRLVRQAAAFLSVTARALDGRRGTLIQVTGAPARRTNPERGVIAAGMSGVRALAHAAAQELRESGVHVALVIVDGIIESPKTAAMAKHLPREALVQHEDVARAVRFLAAQSPRGMTHELVLTPVGGRWVP